MGSASGRSGPEPEGRGDDGDRGRRHPRPTGSPGQGPESGVAGWPAEGPVQGKVPGAGAVLGLVLVVAVLYLLGGIPLQLLLGEPGLVLAQLLFLAGPPILFVFWGGYDIRLTFAWQWPDRWQALGGVVLLAAGTQIAWFLAWLQSLVVPVPVEFLEAMTEMLTAESPQRFFWLLFMVAVIPAIAEEVLFRGALLSGMRRGLPVLGAVAVTGLIFGVFHLAPQTGFRILPTAWLGMVLAWVVVCSGSLPLAMLLHFLNNAAILAMVAHPLTRELARGTEEAPPLVLLPLALIMLAIGLWMLGRPPEMGGRPSPRSRPR